MFQDWKSLARLRRPGERLAFGNGGWRYDAYPELESLDAGRAITVAEFEGPGVVVALHSTQHTIHEQEGAPEESVRRALCARGVVLEVYYNGVQTPAVSVPLADFFADGCGGLAQDFSTPFVEKAPGSYNGFIPMPFERSVRVVLRNETGFDLANYSFVEAVPLPEWDPSLGYFHAAWNRFAFQLTRQTDRPFFHVDGRGHLLGRQWSIATDEPIFRWFHFVMEGNNEVRIDGEPEPRVDYLGSEDSFGVAWGWQRPFIGLRHGTPFVQHLDPALASMYRFHTTNAIPFERSLDWRVDWTHEFASLPDYLKLLEERFKTGGLWVDYATTHYWYQEKVGYPHEALPPVEERIRPVLRENPL